MAALKREALNSLATEDQGVVSVRVDGILVSRFETAVLPLVRDAIGQMAQG
jgi:hypothetical protein